MRWEMEADTAGTVLSHKYMQFMIFKSLMFVLRHTGRESEFSIMHIFQGYNDLFRVASDLFQENINQLNFYITEATKS